MSSCFYDAVLRDIQKMEVNVYNGDVAIGKALCRLLLERLAHYAGTE